MSKEFVKEKFTVNGADPNISADVISTIVTLRENGIPDCKLVANNDKGKMYLNTIHMGDIVEVSYCYTDNDIENWEVVFKGKVYELSPTFTKVGEICQVVAYGNGYPIKLMRVAEEYGVQGRINIFDPVPISNIFPVKTFSFIRDEWNKGTSIDSTLHVDGWTPIQEPPHQEWTHVNTEPWLHDDDNDNVILDSATDDAVGDYDEYYTFENLPSGLVDPLRQLQIRLYLKGKLFDGAGGHATLVTVRLWIWDNYLAIWKNCGTVYYDSTSWQTRVLPVYITNTVSTINNARLKVELSGVQGGGADKGGIRLTYAYLHITGFDCNGYPWLDEWDDDKYIYTHDEGDVDEYYTFEPILFQEETVIESLKLQLIAKNADGYPLSSHIRCYIYFDDSWHDLGTRVVNSNSWRIAEWDIYPEPYSTLTPEQINNLRLRIKLEDTYAGNVYITQARLNITSITGKPCTLKNILTNASKGIIPRYVKKIFGGNNSGHDLNTDYIYDYPDEYNYIYYPFELAFDCLQELIKIASAMEGIKDKDSGYKNWKGLHWIVTPNNELLLAPVGNHSCSGTRPDIEAKWNSRPLLTPIVVKQDMIVELFKTEAHQANYVIVAGKYCLPMGDIWCEANGFKGWKQTEFEMFDGIDGSSFSFDYATAANGNGSLRFHHWSTGGGEAGRHIYRQTDLNFNMLAGQRNKAVICLQAYHSVGDPTSVRVRLYTSTNPPYQNDGDYFETYNLMSIIKDKWSIIELPVTRNDIDNVEDSAIWSKHGSPSWTSIKQIAIQFYHSGGLPWEYVVHIDDLHIVGDTLRAAYDSTKINSPNVGCRMITIKNSIAQTDSLDPDDDSTPLAQNALYELLRHREDITSGSIQIPLTPQLKAGQIVHVQSVQTQEASTIPVNIIKNSGFETGTLSDWVYGDNAVVNGTAPKNGNYSCKLLSLTGWIQQEFTPLLIDNITQFAMWEYGHSNVYIKNQNDVWTYVFSNADITWTYRSNLKDYLIMAGITAVKGIKIIAHPTIQDSPAVDDIKIMYTTSSIYTIDREFRILELEHRFDKNGAFTTLKLISDLQNSFPLNLTDPYQVVMRAVSPDFQTKTFASIRTEGAFDIGLQIIAKDYPT